ncbi:MAG TPA: hypothetical protein VMM13_05580, partial [Euzebya sp.]|nr:hypothetical protein [Euzebya sp.]
AALEARLPSLVKPDAGWGGASPEEIEELQAVLVEGGFLEEVMPVDQIWTDALLEQINDFDEADVVTAAEGADG